MDHLRSGGRSPCCQKSQFKQIGHCAEQQDMATVIRTRMITLLASLMIVAPLLGSAAPAPAASPLRSHITLGTWATNMNYGPGALEVVEKMVGTKFGIASYYYGYGDLFPADMELAYADGGSRDVLLAWNMGPTRFTEWTAGQHDDYLMQIAALARAYPYDVYVRPWPEMNGDWQDFMPTANGDRAHGGTPAEFIAAWRHVVTTLRSAGANNIKWVFNPYAATYAGTADVRELWPGSDYVDVLGMDGFNWGGGPAPWQSFDEIFGPMYNILTSLDPNLPVWICETSSKEPRYNDGAPKLRNRDKGQWIQEAFSSTAFPRVSAVAWFHGKKERDWRIDSSKTSLKAFQDQVRLMKPSATVATTKPARGKKATTTRSAIKATSTKVTKTTKKSKKVKKAKSAKAAKRSR